MRKFVSVLEASDGDDEDAVGALIGEFSDGGEDHVIKCGSST